MSEFDDPQDQAPEAEGRALRLGRVARTIQALRKRRSEFLHRAMLGEPAYDMLLGLYVAELDGQSVIATRLGELAGVAQSSALRWLDYLVTKQLIIREPHPTNKRASIVRLSGKGRDSLEGMFRAMLEGLHEAAL